MNAGLFTVNVREENFGTQADGHLIWGPLNTGFIVDS